MNIDAVVAVFVYILILLVVIAIILFAIINLNPKFRSNEALYSIDTNLNSTSLVLDTRTYNTFAFDGRSEIRNYTLYIPENNDRLSDRINILNITNNYDTILYIKANANVRLIQESIYLNSGEGATLTIVNDNVWNLDKIFNIN